RTVNDRSHQLTTLQHTATLYSTPTTEHAHKVQFNNLAASEAKIRSHQYRMASGDGRGPVV
ncbi:hypothetical protein, partial [Mycobacterium leprae]|uniref:hypothetical protein n=1 Tax=Mycobacterium leprae TaxID=1769 RepID=UPI001E5C48A1